MKMMNKSEYQIAATIAVMLIFSIICYVYYSTQTNRTLGSERFHNSLVSSSLSIEAKVTVLHKIEKEFLLSRELRLQSVFDETIQAIYTELDSKWTDNIVHNSAPLLKQLHAYHAAVEQQFKLHKSIGLDQDSGLEGKLRNSAHKAEDLLIALKDDTLLSHLMYLRRHEKDYMLRGDDIYVEKFYDRIQKMRSILAQRNWSKDQKSELTQHLDGYEDNFQKWLVDRLNVQTVIKNTDNAFALTELYTKQLIRQAAEGTKAAAESNDNHRNVTSKILMLLGGICIIATILLVSMIMRHKKLAVTVEKLAKVDPLTSLPNRRHFFQKLNADVESEDSLSIGLIDLDGFKSINDIYGHAAGDQLLEAASARLTDQLQADVFLARLGGDEFGIILNTPQTEEKLFKLGERICMLLKQPFTLNFGTVSIGGTIGFAQFPEFAKTTETLFEYADYALYHSKYHSKGHPVLFSKEHEHSILSQRKMEQCLIDANLEEELQVHYQPIVDTHSGRTVGMEALARWNNPQLGFVSPAQFIPAAENLGIISKLTTILMEKALKVASSWTTDTYLSFNLSASDLASPETPLKLMAIIMRSGFSPKRLVFEITETTMMVNFERANEVLRPFRDLGVEIALDDFGTGYSSLGYIQKMPIDRLKIDRAFVSDLEAKKISRDIMGTIVDLCSHLEIKCIVEGVETHKQLELVQLLGCHLIQGYYYSKPLPTDEANEFLKQNTNASMNDWQLVS